MRIKLFVIIISLVTASIFMSGGYGLWEKSLTIQGSIEVARPPELNRHDVGSALLPAIILEEPQAANISGSEGELDPEEEVTPDEKVIPDEDEVNPEAENTPDELNDPK